ncbi:hypothetical protein P691DRAFT_662752, partial [Macrolepiota fuliginosa MF-IS2]
LSDEIVKLVSNEASFQDKIRKLEEELGVYKRIFSDTNLEKKRWEERYEQLKHDTEKQQESAQASRVIVLLDGDGAIFTPQLIALGQSGGHKVASQLSESIKTHILSLDEIRQFQLSVYVFFNRRGLADTFNRCGHHAAKARLEDFITGFNQATERFMMVDVGSGKEAADAKIKAYLEDEIRLPQTYKILFGGSCHDNGYITTIRSHITSGFKQKLILLKSYAEHAAGFDNLDLPVLSIPGLFISQKLAASVPIQDSFTTLGNQSSPLSHSPASDTPVRTDGSQTAAEPSDRGFGSSPPTTYSRILLKKVELSSTIDSDSSSDNNDEDSLPNHNVGGTRRLNPKLIRPRSSEKPPPCTLFYLADNCKHGSDCRYAHNYILEAEHYDEMKLNARKSPCPAANKNEICTWGDSCCYGHTCPLVAKCHFLKMGKCKFVGADMHKEPKEPKN